MLTKKDNWDNFLKDVLRKPIYWICVVFITMMSYAFDLSNRTVGIDDLSRRMWVGEGNEMLAGTRWGKTLLIRFLSDCEYVPFIDKFLSICFLIISAVLFLKIFYNFFKDSKHLLSLCILFSCLYLSYPLINEIWNYNDSNVVFTGNAVIVSFVLLLLNKTNNLKNRNIFLSSILLSIAISSYESSAFLYVTSVLSILLLEYIQENREKWFSRGLFYSIPLIVAFLLRYIIGFSIIKIVNLSYHLNGGTGIDWHFGNAFIKQCINLIQNTFIGYFLKGLIYLPIGIFVISVFISFLSVFILSIKRKSFLILFLYILIFFSLFFQSIIQGSVMPYRTAQTLQLFCPLAFTMTIYAISKLNKKTIISIAFIVSFYLCYRQSVFLNKSLALNNQRSDNEAAIIRDLGIKLSQFDNSKTVYIVGGSTNLGEFINRQNRPDASTFGGYLYRKIVIHFDLYDNLFKNIEIYQTNVNSVIDWIKIAFHNQKIFGDLFSYYGFDINSDNYITWSIHNRYVQEAVENGMKPLDVKDMGDYILVFLGL